METALIYAFVCENVFRETTEHPNFINVGLEFRSSHYPIIRSLYIESCWLRGDSKKEVRLVLGDKNGDIRDTHFTIEPDRMQMTFSICFPVPEIFVEHAGTTFQIEIFLDGQKIHMIPLIFL